MKECRICHIEKPLNAFYAHPRMSGGVDSKCKECAKAGVRANYMGKREQYQEYERTRALLPHRVEARKAYAKTEAGRAAGNRAKKQWNFEHPIQRAANIMVGNALRKGQLKKPRNCNCCGLLTNDLDGHHDDYAHPLRVRWLCSGCHSAWHKINNPLNGD